MAATVDIVSKKMRIEEVTAKSRNVQQCFKCLRPSRSIIVKLYGTGKAKAGGVLMDVSACNKKKGVDYKPNPVPLSGP